MTQDIPEFLAWLKALTQPSTPPSVAKTPGLKGILPSMVEDQQNMDDKTKDFVQGLAPGASPLSKLANKSALPLLIGGAGAQMFPGGKTLGAGLGILSLIAMLYGGGMGGGNATS